MTSFNYIVKYELLEVFITVSYCNYTD